MQRTRLQSGSSGLSLEGLLRRVRPGLAIGLALAACFSCATWERLTANVPDYEGKAPDGQASGPVGEREAESVPFDLIALTFYRKADDRPLTVSARQAIAEVNESSAKGHVSLSQKERAVQQMGHVMPLVGLSVQFASDSADVPQPVKNTDTRGAVAFRRGEDYHDCNPDVYYLRYTTSVHLLHEMRALGGGTLKLPGGSKDEAHIEVYLDWDGRFLMRIDR